jgi:hypothetical protein
MFVTFNQCVVHYNNEESMNEERMNEERMKIKNEESMKN